MLYIWHRHSFEYLNNCGWVLLSSHPYFGGLNHCSNNYLLALPLQLQNFVAADFSPLSIKSKKRKNSGKIFHWFRCQRSEFTIKWNIVANDQGCIGKDILCSFVDVLPVHYVTVSTVDSLSWILFRLWPTSCHCQPIVFPHYTTASLCEVFSVTPVTYFLSLPAYNIAPLCNGFSLWGILRDTCDLLIVTASL